MGEENVGYERNNCYQYLGHEFNDTGSEVNYSSPKIDQHEDKRNNQKNN